MELSSQLTRGIRATVAHWIGGWTGHRTGLDAVAKRKALALVGNQNPIVQSIA
jgi:hypothetical protein